MILPRAFFSRDSVTVARELLGAALVRRSRAGKLTGMIAETEAYADARDSASHARHGMTSRNAPMFGPAGVAYVYLVYGMHHMLNVVTEKPDIAGAVLIRALHRLKSPADGPGKVCRALHIDRRFNHWDLTLGKRLWLESRKPVPDRFVSRGPRVGVSYAAEADRQAPWRFRILPSWWTEEAFGRIR